VVRRLRGVLLGVLAVGAIGLLSPPVDD
jgi:hypothetical protein